jgi:hypothetical protein
MPALKRDLPVYLAIVLVLTALGGLIWMTRDPGHPAFDRAERWAWVGPRIAALRRPYLDQPNEGIEGSRVSPEEPAPDTIYHYREVAAGDSSSVSERENTYVGVGVFVRTAPDRAAPLIYATRNLDDFPVRSRLGTWVEIELRDGRSGWFDPEAPRVKEPPLGSDPLPPAPLRARPPSPERSAFARSLLDERSLVERPLGLYRLLTDVAVGDQIESLAATLHGLEKLYTGRYGLTLVGEPAETVVLFATEAQYRQLESAVPELRGSGSAGYASGGLVATFLGERTSVEVEATVVHEITHLLSRRALGPALPPWLDEGLADELAWMALPRAEGRTIYEGLRRVERDGNRVTYHDSGPLAGLRLLRDRLAAGRLLALERLVSDSWPEEAQVSGAMLYTHASFFVHYLLERRHPHRWDAGWRAFLAAVAAGEPPSGVNLLAALGTDWPTLEMDFRVWLLLEAARAGVGEVEVERQAQDH